MDPLLSNVNLSMEKKTFPVCYKLMRNDFLSRLLNNEKNEKFLQDLLVFSSMRDLKSEICSEEEMWEVILLEI